MTDMEMSKMTADEIRAEIATLEDGMTQDERQTTGHPTHARIRGLMDELMARGAACFFCLFGQFPKSARCDHD